MPDAYPDYAVMVICAADVDQIWHLSTKNGGVEQANPTLPSQTDIGRFNIGYVHDGNFDAIGQLRCDDVYISRGDNVYYGLVLIAKQPVGPMAKGDILIALRGTMDQLEWLNDATALTMVPGEAGMKGSVGAGFWQIYQSMAFGDLAGSMVTGAVAARLATISADNKDATVFVCGHSLGAALATYLAYDLNQQLGADAIRLRPYFFASPKTGTSDWVNWCQKAMERYDLANYALDFVPLMPPDGDTLNPGGATHNVHIIPAKAPGALDTGEFAQFDWAANHSPVGYALMLDGANPVALRLKAAS